MTSGNDGLWEQLTSAVAAIQSRTSVRPRVAVILGSGLGAFAETLQRGFVLDYSQLPHFPIPSVEGHTGRLFVGEVAKTSVIALQGRAHGYEGFSPREVTFPVRFLAALGVKSVVITNAAGGIRQDFKHGDLVLISDHINFTGVNPLAGLRDPRLGPRFPDMTHLYSKALRELAKSIAASRDSILSEGVYMGVSGPSFETPAEIKAFRSFGADMVGMSTVHEAIVARQAGMDVLGISCITNLAAGLENREISHGDVLEAAERSQGQLTALLTDLIPQIASE